MKKITAVVFVIITLFFQGYTGKANAADLGIGIISYYAWWEPAIRDEYDNFETEPLLMYGPVLSFTFFEKFTLTGVFLKNPEDMSEVSFDMNFTGSNGPGSISLSGTTDRGDMDISLSYALSENINIFLGYKWLEYAFRGDFEVTSGSYSMPSITDADLAHSTWGPACGLSFSLAVNDKISSNLGISILYAESSDDYKYCEEYTPGNIDVRGVKVKSDCYGFNTTLNFSYYLESIDTVLSLGGRFQYLTYRNISGDFELADDYFYGLTLSAMYYF